MSSGRSPNPEDRPSHEAEDATALTPADIRWGLIYTHDRANQNTAALEEVAAAVEGLVGLLVERGILTDEEVAEAEDRAVEDVRRRFKEAGMAVITQEHGGKSK